MLFFNKIEKETGIPTGTGFNPCFNGCCSSTINTKGNQGLLRIVSILVLMDVVLQPECYSILRRVEELFQSLF